MSLSGGMPIGTLFGRAAAAPIGWRWRPDELSGLSMGAAASDVLGRVLEVSVSETETAEYLSTSIIPPPGATVRPSSARLSNCAAAAALKAEPSASEPPVAATTTGAWTGDARGLFGDLMASFCL